MKLSRRNRVLAIAAALVVVAGGVVLAVSISSTQPSAPAHSRVAAVSTPPPAPTSEPPYTAPTAAEIASLPVAIYSAVIPGLIGYANSSVPAVASAVYSIAADAPVYGSNRQTAVARFAAKNFLGNKSVIVPVKVDGPWTLILTPSRQSLPSQKPGAPAQSAAWIRSSLLIKGQDLHLHIVVSVSAQTVSIVDSTGKATQVFKAGVGANQTPTPTGVVGYLQAAYLDPAQDETVYPIELTSLHSSAADEPFGGKDGGLIGIHYQAAHSGAISHGCVRLDASSISAINELPLGTPVTIEK